MSLISCLSFIAWLNPHHKVVCVDMPHTIIIFWCQTSFSILKENLLTRVVGLQPIQNRLCLHRGSCWCFSKSFRVFSQIFECCVVVFYCIFVNLVQCTGSHLLYSWIKFYSMYDLSCFSCISPLLRLWRVKSTILPNK